MKAIRHSLTALTLAVVAGAAQAQISDGVIKIGVLSDMSSLYTDLAGAGSVVAARMAVEDSGIEKRGIKVEIVSADHQNKADVGSNIVRQWYDVDKVDVVVDTPNSGVALAVNQITRDKGKAFLVSGAASSDLTGKACSPNTIHWTYDTWMLANGTGSARVRSCSTGTRQYACRRIASPAWVSRYARRSVASSPASTSRKICCCRPR